MDSASDASGAVPAEPRSVCVARAAKPAQALDNVVHQRARLGIASALAAGEALSFTRLKDLLGLTDGNLSVHLQRLEKAGYVSCEKSVKKPSLVAVSRYRLTRRGREALRAYLSQMEAIIEAARRDVENPDGRLSAG